VGSSADAGREHLSLWHVHQLRDRHSFGAIHSWISSLRVSSTCGMVDTTNPSDRIHCVDVAGADTTSRAQGKECNVVRSKHHLRTPFHFDATRPCAGRREDELDSIHLSSSFRVHRIRKGFQPVPKISIDGSSGTFGGRFSAHIFHYIRCFTPPGHSSKSLSCGRVRFDYMDPLFGSMQKHEYIEALTL
jgi:hypothetical protein